MTAARVRIRRCPTCGGSRVAEVEDQRTDLLCLCCGRRETIRDARREAYLAEVAAVRGHQQPGPKRGRPKRGGVAT